ncbi:unnamed protein product [Psylliodes chrysocephalus]|uniref:THAP-type domain-containing protein n=1 Tax=Psylliodes chrysocephalus TaxID=3402493 RepID=A0A9P0D8P6_9CUCU|nr:unnamed protein product [Psylliodes chrysocephala]
MASCSVAVCKRNFYNQKLAKERISFFAFPKNDRLQKIWVERCFRKNQFNVKTAKICSVHFKGEDFIDDIRARVMGTEPKLKLKANALPTLHLKPDGHNVVSYKYKTQTSARSQRALKKERKVLVEEIIKRPPHVDSPALFTNLSNLSSTSIKSDENKIKREYERLLEQNKMLINELEKTKEELSQAKKMLKMLEQNESNMDFIIKKRVTDLLKEVFNKNELEVIFKN